ncbi:MAG TPA: SDR family NAD(P)-dependent oxidoreductase [Candidatus Thermoplasmatota archaeon]|nr:SDR family NAD(P)-dependent oxidoreductase [Candidatus Thermoplasmatota archaeon]
MTMNNDLFNLDGKVAIITGAARGLGKSIAVGLAKFGAHVVITDVIDTSGTLEEIKKFDDQSFDLQVDVSDESDVETMIKKTIDHFGSIDILVNNAGILKTANAEDFSEDDWKKVIDVNLNGVFLCAQAAGKQMIEQKSGKIINISSIAGLSGYASSVAYSASKAGVISLTKTLAAEWGKHNIQVNAICPGVFATNMTEDYLKDEDFKEMIKTKVPLSRYAKSDELIGTIIYLASNASDYMTGHALVIDGGWTSAL